MVLCLTEKLSGVKKKLIDLEGWKLTRKLRTCILELQDDTLILKPTIFNWTELPTRKSTPWKLQASSKNQAIVSAEC